MMMGRGRREYCNRRRVKGEQTLREGERREEKVKTRGA
jgi:hypothetical protein